MAKRPVHPGWDVVAGSPPRQQRGAGPTYRRSTPDDGFGAVLTSALAEAHLTQMAVARQIDVNATLISRMATGAGHPSLWLLSRLVDVLPHARKRLIESALAGATRKEEAL